MLADNEYKCSYCGGIFEFVRDETWSMEKAKKEFEEMFPNSRWETGKIVCDDCWNKIKPNEPVYE